MDTNPSTHPALETLEAYGLGPLDEGGADAVARHLEVLPPSAGVEWPRPRPTRSWTGSGTPRPDRRSPDRVRAGPTLDPVATGDSPVVSETREPPPRTVRTSRPPARHPRRLLRRLRAAESAGRRGHGDRLQGPAAQPEPPGGLEDDQGRPVRLRRRGPPVPERGRGGRPARPPQHRADLRGRPVSRTSITSA